MVSSLDKELRVSENEKASFIKQDISKQENSVQQFAIRWFITSQKKFTIFSLRRILTASAFYSMNDDAQCVLMNKASGKGGTHLSGVKYFLLCQEIFSN